MEGLAREAALHVCDDPADVQRTVRAAGALRGAGGVGTVRVVVDGPALAGVTGADDVRVADRVEVLACLAGMRQRDIAVTDLRPGVQTVPSAVVTLVDALARRRCPRAGMSGRCDRPGTTRHRPSEVAVTARSDSGGASQVGVAERLAQPALVVADGRHEVLGRDLGGWCRSKAGRSERTRGMVVKSRRGGGQLVAHSSEPP